MRPDDGPGAPVALAVAEDPVRLRPPLAVPRVAVALGLLRHHQLVAAEGALRLAARVRDALPQGEPAVDADGHPFAEHGVVAQGDGRDQGDGGGQERGARGRARAGARGRRARPATARKGASSITFGRSQTPAPTRAPAAALIHHGAAGPGCARASTTSAASSGSAERASGRRKFELKARCGDRAAISPPHDAHPPADQPRRGQGEQHAAGGGQRVLHELGREEAAPERARRRGRGRGDTRAAARAGPCARDRDARGQRMPSPRRMDDRGLVVAPGHARARLHARIHDGREVQRVQRPHGHGEQEDRGERGHPRAPRRRRARCPARRRPGSAIAREGSWTIEQFTPRMRFARVRPPPPEIARRLRPPRYNRQRSPCPSRHPPRRS